MGKGVTRGCLLVTLPWVFGACVCHSEGCVNGVSFDFVSESTVVELQDLEITLCRNSDCTSDTPTRLSESSASASCGPEIEARSRCYVTVGNDSFRIVGTLDSRVADAHFVDGDEVRVLVVHRTTGRTLVDARESVKYEDIYPNGPNCGDTPCRHARM